MMRQKTVEIAGAGISGLVAGIILARGGRRVRVFEAGSAIGRGRSWADCTLMDPEALRRETGIDVRDAVEPWRRTRVWAYGRRYELESPRGVGAFTVERGAGESSIDNLLYRQALEAGVEVVFGRRLSRQELRELPPGSIIATGLDRETFEALDIPCRPFYCHMASGKAVEEHPEVIVYFDRFTREFGYYCRSHDVADALVFHVLRPLLDGEKEEFMYRLAANDGIELTGWHDEVASWAAWPIGGWNNLRLFAGDKVLAGTVAGAVSPPLVFGVNGALATGRIAALAVTDRDRAAREFGRLAPLYRPQFLLRKMREYLPHPVLKHIVRAILGSYDPVRFPFLMEFAMWPPGLPVRSRRRDTCMD